MPSKWQQSGAEECTEGEGRALGDGEGVLRSRTEEKASATAVGYSC